MNCLRQPHSERTVRVSATLTRVAATVAVAVAVAVTVAVAVIVAVTVRLRDHCASRESCIKPASKIRIGIEGSRRVSPEAFVLRCRRCLGTFSALAALVPPWRGMYCPASPHSVCCPASSAGVLPVNTSLGGMYASARARGAASSSKTQTEKQGERQRQRQRQNKRSHTGQAWHLHHLLLDLVHLELHRHQYHWWWQFLACAVRMSQLLPSTHESAAAQYS